MEYEGLPEVRLETELWNQLDELRQNRLMGESQFLSFLQDRGLPVSGVVGGEPGEFVRRMWLDCDKRDGDGSPLFHPFRMFPVHRILERCDLRISTTNSLHPHGYLRLAERLLKEMPRDDEFRGVGREWNRVVDLAVLLEPIYWPGIVERRPWSGYLSEENAWRGFRSKTLDFLRTLDSKLWKRVHECLLIDAAWLDDNPMVYVLLRVAKWEQRETLKGRLSAALWLRHMAEVIRCGFEEAFDERWPEEYEGFGHWPEGTKERIFGAERPLDSAMRTKPFVAREFGLFTGSSVRWYVEGDTEYFAFLELLSDPVYYSIELVNLHGEVAARRGNTVMKLENMLREDRRLRRFSMISLDGDVGENKRFTRIQILDDNLVGKVAWHNPDFEFANFSFTELVEIAATMDESMGLWGSPIRDAKCGAITGAKAFEQWYRSASTRSGADLKGEAWGRALGRYASEHPKTEAGHERPMIGQMRAAAFGWSTAYVSHHRHFTLDPDTFEVVRRAPDSR